MIKKVCIFAVAGCIAFFNNASAEEALNNASQAVDQVQSIQGSETVTKKKRQRVSDAVKEELKQYKAKKKELYENLSQDAKDALSRHNHNRFSRTRNKTKSKRHQESTEQVQQEQNGQATTN